MRYGFSYTRLSFSRWLSTQSDSGRPSRSASSAQANSSCGCATLGPAALALASSAASFCDHHASAGGTQYGSVLVACWLVSRLQHVHVR